MLVGMEPGWIKEVCRWGRAFEGDTQPGSCLAPCFLGHRDGSSLCLTILSDLLHHTFLLGHAEALKLSTKVHL